MASVSSTNFLTITYEDLQRAQAYVKGALPCAIGCLGARMLSTYCDIDSLGGIPQLVTAAMLSDLEGKRALSGGSDSPSFGGSLGRGFLVSAGYQIAAALIDPDSYVGGSSESFVKNYFVALGSLASDLSPIVGRICFLSLSFFVLKRSLNSKIAAGALFDIQIPKEIALESQEKTINS